MPAHTRLTHSLRLLCLLPLVAWAQPAPPSLQQLLKQVASQPPETAWQHLQQHASHYLNDPDYNYALGVYASASGNYGQAINAFERAVLLQPSHAGAWLDLAIAYRRAGDSQTALELLAHIRTNLHPPAYLQPLLEEFTRDWQPPSPWTSQLRLEAGHSTNPAAAASSTNIPLYLGQWTSLPLADNHRPSASPYASLGVDLQRQQAGHQLTLGASLRHYPHTDSANQHQLLLAWQPPKDPWGYWHLGYSQFDIAYAGSQHTLSLLRLLPVTPQLHLGAGLRLRRYQQPALDANIPLLLLAHTQPLASGTLGLSLWHEHETPTGIRPGGAGQRTTASLAWQQPLPIGSLQLTASISHYRDTSHYSPVIPLQRHLTWQQLRAQWQLPATPHTQLHLALQHDWQNANHRLFAWQDTQLSLGITYRP